MQKAIAAVLSYFVFVSSGLAQKPNTVTCTGPMIDLSLKPLASLAVVYDLEGAYACVLVKRGGNDPLRPCSAGHECRLEGTYTRKNDTTYVIDRVTTVEVIEE